MDAYQDFAYVYDELMDTTPYQEWCERIHRLIKKYGVSNPAGRTAQSPEDAPGTGDVAAVCSLVSPSEDLAWREREEWILASERNLVVDLGCGTGTLTELLYRKGYDMIGIDQSPEMLSVAMEKKEENGSEILYLQQDMRDLELYSTVGTVVSVCDSVNYILEEDELRQTFSLVNNYLYPGGIFIFDFNTEYKYREVIGDTVIAENREECSFIWENYYHAEECVNEYDLTIFVREEDELFRRFTETHFQRGYTPQEMERLLEEAGLELIGMWDSDTGGEVTPESQRVYVVARECCKRLRAEG